MKCVLRAERHDGNDPIEAEVELPIIPRKGDQIEVWSLGNPLWLIVGDVVLSVYAPEHIEVWVRMEGYDFMDLQRALDAAKSGECP